LVERNSEKDIAQKKKINWRNDFKKKFKSLNFIADYLISYTLKSYVMLSLAGGADTSNRFSSAVFWRMSYM
jgi:hypothetical protein